MAAQVYLDRDNNFTLNLTQDGQPPESNAITRAAVWIPGDAFNDGQPVVVDSDGSELSLIDDATKISAKISSLELVLGRHLCYLTIYDAVNTDGIAWDSFSIYVREWPTEVQ